MKCIKHDVSQYEFRYNNLDYHRRYNRLNNMRNQHVSIVYVASQILNYTRDMI